MEILKKKELVQHQKLTFWSFVTKTIKQNWITICQDWLQNTEQALFYCSNTAYPVYFISSIPSQMSLRPLNLSTLMATHVWCTNR